MNNILTVDRLQTMIEMQDKMNTKVNPDWRTAGNAWLRAVVVEGAEAIEHHGWKWWKKQTPDLPQLQIELVDIWHFYLSHFIETDQVAESIVTFLSSSYYAKGFIFDGTYYALAEMDTLRKLELLVGMAAVRKTNVKLLESIMTDVGMTWEGMYQQYVAKNVLNFFRQDHGYKDGTYIKVWNGHEDNVHLAGIMQYEQRPDQIYGQLKDIYSGVVAQAQVAN